MGLVTKKLILLQFIIISWFYVQIGDKIIIYSMKKRVLFWVSNKSKIKVLNLLVMSQYVLLYIQGRR